MSISPSETKEVHTKILRCALQIEEARAYWSHAGNSKEVTAQEAFDQYWFGACSLSWVKVLLANLRARFDAFPSALSTLHRWHTMSPDTRRLVCHWHLQLTDPMYRRFTGHFLNERRSGARPSVTRDLVVSWVESQGPGRWTMTTRMQFASKLLSSAFAAGLFSSNRDPRPITLPRVPDDALEYLMYLLREVSFDGTLLDNRYTASIGLAGAALEDRLARLPGMRFQRQGDLVEFGWRFPDLAAWAEANLPDKREELT